MTADLCAFSGFPLDPADHLRSDQKWLAAAIRDKNSRFLLYSFGRPLMLLSQDLAPCFKTAADLEDFPPEDFIFVGLQGDQATFALEVGKSPLKDRLKGRDKFIDLRSVAMQCCEKDFSDLPSLLGRGKMLLDWNGRRYFCSCCGHKTLSKNGGYLRVCENSDCKAEHFPRTDPVVIMLVTRGEKCLLGRSAHFPPGNYSALAGFMEPGESIEEAVRREVLEEAGIKVGAVSYVKSQPWPFPSSLMIGVMAEGLSEEIDLEGDELEDAFWIEKKELIETMASGGNDKFRVPPRIAIARHLLEQWVNE